MNYDTLLGHIATLHGLTTGSADAVKQALLVRNWLMGAWIVGFEQFGADGTTYETGLLESAFLDHLARFLLELGTDFCFEARQKRITVGNEHDWIDLVFYHRVLRCYLAVLPSPEDLQRLVAADRALLEQRSDDDKEPQ